MSDNKTVNDAPQENGSVTVNPHAIASRRKFSLSATMWKWIGAGLVVVIGFAGYIAYSVFQNVETDAAACTTKTLSSGAASSCVKYAQQLLNGVSDYFSVIPNNGNSLPSTAISTNGKYSSSTVERVKAFQSYSGKASTGTIDKNTWYNLCDYTQRAYKSFSTNLRTDAIKDARTAYTKVGCSSASPEADTPQDSMSTTSDSDDISDSDESSDSTLDSPATINDSDRDKNAEQVVGNTTSPAQSLTVVTWNIAGGSTNFNAAQRLQGLETLDDSADIISLQESHKADFRSLLRDQYLCTICSDGSSSYIQGLQLQGVPKGADIYASNSTPPASVPILWRRERFALEGYGAYTILANVYKDENGGKVTRKWITWVRLHDKQSNQSFYVLNLHTPAGVEKDGTPIAKMKKRNSTYKYGMELIQKIVKNNFSNENLPIIVTGDFNVDYRTDKTVRYKYYPYVTMANIGFTSNWAFADANGGLPSGGTGSSARLIDYVFIKRGVGMSFEKTAINSDMFGSDHHPVIATIDISSN